jgi:hypothetical protein
VFWASALRRRESPEIAHGYALCLNLVRILRLLALFRAAQRCFEHVAPEERRGSGITPLAQALLHTGQAVMRMRGAAE